MRGSNDQRCKEYYIFGSLIIYSGLIFGYIFLYRDRCVLFFMIFFLTLFISNSDALFGKMLISMNCFYLYLFLEKGSNIRNFANLEGIHNILCRFFFFYFIVTMSTDNIPES